MSNRLTLFAAFELHSAKRIASGRESFRVNWFDGSHSEAFPTPEAAAESIDAQHTSFPLSGRPTVDDDWRIRSVDGDRIGVIEEIAE